MSAFEDIAAGQPASVVAAALEIAIDEYPQLDVRQELHRIRVMAQRAAQVANGETSVPGRLTRLARFFFGELGFSGNFADYYDPRNSYLNQVIARRQGIPISLSLLYRELAAAAGLQLEGVNLPGHFLLVHQSAQQRLYVDVFGGGRLMDWSGCRTLLGHLGSRAASLKESRFPPMMHSEVLARLLRNLKSIYSRGDFRRCLRVQERLVRLAPGQPSELRDLGILYYHNGRAMPAMITLEGLCREHPRYSQQRAVQNYLRKATGIAVLMN